MTSLKISAMASAQARSRVRLVAMMPPKGAWRSVAKARSQASRRDSLTDAAGVGVFEDGEGGRFGGELGDQGGGGGQVEDVVVGEFLAVAVARRIR
jgi:hypothetical protein